MKFNMVTQLFNPQEASRIISMPILNREEDDNLVWGRSRSGLYSVKSAYFAIMEELTDQSGLRMDGEWITIWKLRIPQKVKLLLWRANRGCLPTRCNLQRRHVQCASVIRKMSGAYSLIV